MKTIMKSTITIIDKQGIIRFQKFGIFIFLLFFSTLTLSHSQQELLQYYNNKPASYQPRTKYIENNKAIFVNHLIASNSPYLLQHAHNPVDWYQFNDEAFNLAKSQRKLIFLSIGYATCHWCHVMEDESFEDLAVAKVLNDNFISIKVDREVLPDVDSHFMNISALINGNGGWPLNVVLTPNGDGFFAGTYFPKDDLITHLQDIQKVWNSDKQKILTIAKTISNALIRKNDTAKKLPLTLQKTAIDELLIKFDEFYGGFSEAPKFPKESQLLMLLDAQQRSPNKHIREAIITTLDNMASGGMYDIVAGGFHRYATDNEWIFPHFEKMLYNQAQLAMVYIKAHQVTRKDSYKRIAIQTLDYVLREMQHKNGGFYSATDADSSGAEGVFFTWSTAEIKQVLDDDFMLFSKYFDLSRATKFEERHVIHYKDFAKLSATDFRKIQPLLDKLYSVRQQREKPLLDNKILLSWNALLLKAFVVASEIDNKYLLYAQNLAQFLTTHFYNNTLKRVKIDNQVAQNGIFEDYIYFADGLLALFDATENVKYLQLSQQLVDEAIDKFWDTKYFGFRVSNNKYINNNNKEIYDGAIVSSNGIAYAVLQKLSDRTQLDKYKKLAKQLVQSFSTTIVQQPSSYPTIITSYIAKKRGVLTKKVYVYDGKIRIERRADKVLIHMQKGWHINAHDISTQGIIPTTLNGNIKNIIYPKGEMIDLGFSNEKLAVYTNTIEISFDDNTAQQLTLTIQACSDKICLPPQTIILGATLF